MLNKTKKIHKRNKCFSPSINFVVLVKTNGDLGHLARSSRNRKLWLPLDSPPATDRRLQGVGSATWLPLHPSLPRHRQHTLLSLTLIWSLSLYVAHFLLYLVSYFSSVHSILYNASPKCAHFAPTSVMFITLHYNVPLSYYTSRNPCTIPCYQASSSLIYLFCHLQIICLCTFLLQPTAYN